MDNPMPDFGCFSMQGLCDSMHDVWFVQDNFCRPPFLATAPLHFFAIYDGHGKSHVSTTLKELMHIALAIDLESVDTTYQSPTGENIISSENLIQASLDKTFQTMNDIVTREFRCVKGDNVCTCDPPCLNLVGSTALVAVISPNHITVANCGDSRAVLCRGGRAIPLSIDHKIEREGELERMIRDAGENVVHEAIEVYGVNVSRGLGSGCWRRLMSAEPEITVTEKVSGGGREFLVLGSDGIWNVMSNELVAEIATLCLYDENPGDAIRIHLGDDCELEEMLTCQSKSLLAATAICRLAIARGSRDNVTAIVVNL